MKNIFKIACLLISTSAYASGPCTFRPAEYQVSDDCGQGGCATHYYMTSVIVKDAKGAVLLDMTDQNQNLFAKIQAAVQRTKGSCTSLTLDRDFL